MSVTAKVNLTIEIHVQSNWNDDVMASQVKKQATVDALATLNKIAANPNNNIKIVGTPEITMIMANI